MYAQITDTGLDIAEMKIEWFKELILIEDQELWKVFDREYFEEWDYIKERRIYKDEAEVLKLKLISEYKEIEKEWLDLRRKYLMYEVWEWSELIKQKLVEKWEEVKVRLLNKYNELITNFWEDIISLIINV